MKSVRVLAVALSLGVAAPLALAEAPENYIKYRQAVMKAIGGHMAASSQIVRGNVSPEGALAVHADALASLSKDIASLFPEGSDFGETEAKETIWSDRAGFEEAANAARDATAAFVGAVASGDMDEIAAAHREVGSSCKGCHDDYRIDD